MKKNGIQNIIVAVDLSKYSKLVVQEAIKLASEYKAKVKFVYVRAEVWEPKEYSSDLTELYRKQVQKLYKIKNIDDVIIQYGKPAQAIIRFAKALKNPLIVVGHRGHRPLMRWFLGSTAESIALNSPYPVWIHRGPRTVSPKRVLVPSDLTQKSDQAVSELRKIDESLVKNSELFHVSQEPFPVGDYPAWSEVYATLKANEAERINAFKKTHPTLKSVETLGSVPSEIHKRAKKFDFIAISPSQTKSPFPLFGSVAASIIRSGNKPVLICP